MPQKASGPGNPDRGCGRGHGGGDRGDRPGGSQGGSDARGVGHGGGSPITARTLTPAMHVRAIGVNRPGHGSAGRMVEIHTDHSPAQLHHGTIYHYDVVTLPDNPVTADHNFEIINTLQTTVEPELFARPGAYDGRRNLFTMFEPPFESGSREFVVPMCPPPSPAPEYDTSFPDRPILS